MSVDQPESARVALEDLLAHEFPVEQNLLYLNHAAIAPWPRRAGEAVQRFASECMEYGAQGYKAWVQKAQDLRDQLAALVNAPSPEDIALLKNTSEALSVVAHGFPWKRGDNVIISDEEFPSNRIVWESLARYGVEVRQVSLRAEVGPEAALLAAADARTRLVATSSVQYASGLRMDLALLGQRCRTRGIALCVDAIQGVGAIHHDVQAMHIDFLMADAHKWMLGPEGIALFYCRTDWRERLTLHQYGWHMVEDCYNFDRHDWEPAASARRFECGSGNLLGVHALVASLSLLAEFGMPEVEKRLLARTEYLFELIDNHPDLELLTDPSPGRYAGIVVFKHRRIPTEQLFEKLKSHNVICAMRGGGIRFSPHFYTDPDHLTKAVALLS